MMNEQFIQYVCRARYVPVATCFDELCQLKLREINLFQNNLFLMLTNLAKN
jgi:hypothetical protein